MTRAAIGLGSNVGDRREHLQSARRALRNLGTEVSVSSLYETAPVGPVEQGPFLNAVVVIDTERAPAHLLAALFEIEQRHGRLRDVHWGPRTLDLDILLYGTEDVDLPGLRIPHRELTKRRFAIEPLLEAWPEAALPDGTEVANLLGEVAEQQAVNIGGWVDLSWWQRIRRLLLWRG